MNRDDRPEGYFAQLETALATSTGRGDHLAVAPRRIARVARRATTAALLTLTLALTLVSEFPASARGQVPTTCAAAHAPTRCAV